MDMNRFHVNSIGEFRDWRCGHTRYRLHFLFYCFVKCNTKYCYETTRKLF